MAAADQTALVVVDVQRGFEDARYCFPTARRNNRACEANVAALIGAWRNAGRPLGGDDRAHGRQPRLRRPVRARRHPHVRPHRPGGTLVTADELAGRRRPASLHGEFATVVSTADLLDR